MDASNQILAHLTDPCTIQGALIERFCALLAEIILNTDRCPTQLTGGKGSAENSIDLRPPVGCEKQ